MAVHPISKLSGGAVGLIRRRSGFVQSFLQGTEDYPARRPRWLELPHDKFGERGQHRWSRSTGYVGCEIQEETRACAEHTFWGALRKLSCGASLRPQTPYALLAKSICFKT